MKPRIIWKAGAFRCVRTKTNQMVFEHLCRDALDHKSWRRFNLPDFEPDDAGYTAEALEMISLTLKYKMEEEE